VHARAFDREDPDLVQADRVRPRGRAGAEDPLDRVCTIAARVHAQDVAVAAISPRPPQAPAVGLVSPGAPAALRPAPRAQASPARTIASVSNIFMSVASLSKTARLAAFQVAIFAAPYM
jgi:hypothetical protein